MGKAKRDRGRKRKQLHNPVGIGAGLSNAETLNHEDQSTANQNSVSQNEAAINSVIDQLQSSNVEEKIVGLHALANVFRDPESVGDVLRHKVVKIAGPMLFERSSFVRNAAAGALRNLSACGSHDICDLLVEQDIMTPLTALIQQYATQWEPTKKPKEGKVEDKVDTFIQAVHLLWNLCESNATALKYFNDCNLISVLIPCLDSSTFGMETSVAVAQCLTTVTENNSKAVAKLKESEKQLEKIMNLEGEDALFLRTLTCGLLLNLNNGNIIGLSPTLVTNIMTSISDTLKVDQRQFFNKLTSDMPVPDDINDPENLKRIENVKQASFLLEAQRTALEILANLFSDDNEDLMDQDTSDTSDENFSDSSLHEDEAPSAVENFPLSIPSEVHEAIVGLQLVQRIWEKTCLPAENVCQILADHPDGKQLFSKIKMLQCRAYLCLNNLISGLDVADLGGPEHLKEVWSKVGSLIFSQVKQDDLPLLEAATATLRAALQKLAEIKPIPFLKFHESELQLMFNGSQQCEDANVRANLIRSVGTLAMIITNSPEESSQTMLKSIGRFLLEVGGKDTELWVVAEALDTVMDVFGEDETDQAAAEINLVDKLNSLYPLLKHKVRSQRKSLGEHYLIITTVNTNLSRFIKYKTNRLVSLNTKNGHT